MNDFTASNGVRILPTNTGGTAYSPGGSWPNPEAGTAYFNADLFAALREFFRAEEDERLGRWRWPEDPTIVVYPHETYRSVHVAKDGTPGSTYWAEEEMIWVADSDAPFTRAARDYFDAHPKPKPWHEAKEGEAWVITVNDEQYPAIFQAGRFRDHGGAWTNAVITDARRIWPEVAP